MTHRLNVHYIGMKFRSNHTSNGYQVIERTRNSIANDQREMTPIKIQNRVMVALQMYEVSSKYLLQFSIYRADTML